MTYSILTGVLTGYIVYVIVLIFSVPFLTKFKRKFIDGIDDTESERQGREDDGYEEGREKDANEQSLKVNTMNNASSDLDAHLVSIDTPSSSTKSKVSQRVGKAIYKHLMKESNFIVDMSTTLTVDIDDNKNGANSGGSKKFPRSRTIN